MVLQPKSRASRLQLRAVKKMGYTKALFFRSTNITARHAFFAGFLICLGLMATGLYLQYVEGQEPCPLCILQRIAYISMMAIFLVAAVHNPRSVGVRIYGGLAFVAGLAGTGVAIRYVWLQHLPAAEVPACGPGFAYILKKFPLADALGGVLAGSGECAKVDWTFLSLSIAEWSLVWFVLLTVLTVFITLRGSTIGSSKALYNEILSNVVYGDVIRRRLFDDLTPSLPLHL